MVKLSIHLLGDDCKSLEELTELLNPSRLCQACEHLLYDGLVVQSAALWIQNQFGLLLW